MIPRRVGTARDRLLASAAAGVKSVAFDIVYDAPASSGPQGDLAHASGLGAFG